MMGCPEKSSFFIIASAIGILGLIPDYIMLYREFAPKQMDSVSVDVVRGSANGGGETNVIQTAVRFGLPLLPLCVLMISTVILLRKKQSISAHQDGDEGPVHARLPIAPDQTDSHVTDALTVHTRSVYSGLSFPQKHALMFIYTTPGLTWNDALGRLSTAGFAEPGKVLGSLRSSTNLAHFVPNVGVYPAQDPTIRREVEAQLKKLGG